MKKLFILSLVLLLASINVYAQNLVPNGDFEYNSPCPSTLSQTAYCTGWRQYHSATPDYFHTCASVGTVKPPAVYPSSYQWPASGNGFMGAYSWNSSPSAPNTWTEYIASQMTPLAIGATYEVSLSVVMANGSATGHNGLGVWFYDNGPTSTLTGASTTLSVTPQIQYSNYGNIIDTQNWLRVVDTFIADSAYDNLVIGKFNPSVGLTYTNLTSTGGLSYYYFDSIVVRLISGSVLNVYVADSSYCPGDTISVNYTVSSPSLFSSTNTFTLQLSNASGSFASPVNLASVTGTTSGTIKAVISSSITPGLGYRVRIKSSNRLDSTAANSNNIVIGRYPAKPISTSNSPICENDTLKLFTSTSTTGNVSYIWSGPNSYISTSQNPVISNSLASMSGSYVATALIYGCESKDTIAVTVNPLPANLSATSNSPCVSDTLKLYASSSTSGITWNWVGPSSFNSTQQNPYVANATTAASGDYIVTATLSTGCLAKDTVFVNVKPLPAGFAAGNNSPVCAGSSLQLNGSSSSSSISWSWTGPNSFSSNLQTPVISSATTSATGMYTLTATLNGCSLTSNTYATVNPLPAAPVAGVNNPVCTGQDMKLTASTIPGVSYEWTGPSSYSSTLQNPVRTSATTAIAGNYYVRSLLNGCYSPNSSITVNVVAAPNVSIYPSPKDSICEGATLTLIATVSNAGSNPQYKWHKNNSLISGATTGTYITTTARDLDAYFCSITATGVCYEPYTDSSASISIRVFPWLTPSVSISQTPTGTIASGKLITFNTTPVNGGVLPKYQWKRNNANVVGAIGNTWGAYTLSNKDIVCVEMTSTYLCPTPATVKSNCIEVSIQSTGGSGVDNLNWNNTPPKIYPNPTHDEVIIEGIVSGTRIELTDILGRKVINKVSLSETEKLSVNTLVPGTYMLRLTHNDGSTMLVKLLKE